MASISAWMVAFRLRTLPLALSTIILGSFLAAYRKEFYWGVFVWAVLTTLFLQILSNLANDYGDAVHGVDNQGRVGPKRSLQTGAITLREMRNAILLFVILSLISGVVLLTEGTRGLKLSSGLVMFGVGIAAIGAALKYTMGKNPYGYAGLGDAAVFLFFGIVGVMGSYFLHTQRLEVLIVLPAMSIGFFSAGVLNLNNLRDKENDAACGKRTLVVQLGVRPAKRYHVFLLAAGMALAVMFSFLMDATGWKWIYLLSFPFFIRSIFVVQKNRDSALLDPELRALAMTTLLFSILFGVGLVLK